MNRTTALLALHAQLNTARDEAERAETVFSTLLCGAPCDSVADHITAALARLDDAIRVTEFALAAEDAVHNRPLSPVFDADRRSQLLRAGSGWAWQHQPWPAFVAGLQSHLEEATR